jgi:hypothetical protein
MGCGKQELLGERWGTISSWRGISFLRTAGIASSTSSFLHEAIIGKNFMPHRKRSRLRWYGPSRLIGAKKMQKCPKTADNEYRIHDGTVAEQGDNSVDILILRIDDYQRRVRG